jgi:hypothetical protein
MERLPPLVRGDRDWLLGDLIPKSCEVGILGPCWSIREDRDSWFY